MNKATKLRGTAAAAAAVALVCLPNNLKVALQMDNQPHMIACFMAFKKTYTYWLSLGTQA